MTSGADHVFLSYSHRDTPWKDRLSTHLGVLGKGVDVWSDSRIGTGNEWQEEIRTAIDHASVAILLISPHFLTSSFILNEEVPRVLERRRKEGLRLIPILVTACQWQRIPWLAVLQAKPADGIPLAALSEHEADEALSAIAGEVDDLLRGVPHRPVSGSNRETDRIVETVILEAVNRLQPRVLKLLEQKDREDKQTSNELRTKLTTIERELVTARTSLEQASESSPSYRTFVQRCNRLESDRAQLRAHLDAIEGRRLLDLVDSTEAARDSLMRDMEKKIRWAEQINFLDARRGHRLDRIYVHLDILLYPRRSRGTTTERSRTLPFESLMSFTDNHIVLLGQPGAGKTTSMKRLFLMLHKRVLGNPGLSLPIVLRFRDLNSMSLPDDIANAGVLYGPLLHLLNARSRFSEKLLRDMYRGEMREYQRMIVTSLLDALNATVILDGFDELAGSHRRDAALAEIRELAVALARARLVITSRSGDFNYSIDRVDQFEIAPLDDERIVRFAENWLGDKALAADFVAQIAKSPFKDTTIRPLSLAHLCAIYERAGSVPDQPKAVYRKVVNLLIEEWDEQRSVRRKSTFQRFTSDRRFEFLTSLAFALTSKFDVSTFGYEILARVYEEICTGFGLPADQVTEVFDEIESHTGLFLRVGLDQFEFAHKSIQEYLAAEYIVRLPYVPVESSLLRRLPNEIAIAIAISSDPAAYLWSLVFHGLQAGVERRFYDVFIDRLILERPVFGLDKDAALALIILVSNWSSRGGKTDAKSTVTEVPARTLAKLCVEYADLLQGPGRDIVRTYYADPAAIGGEFVQVRRVRQPKFFRIPTRLIIPSRLAELLDTHAPAV